MVYQNPTLFGLAYASRVFREVDRARAFEELREETGAALNLEYPDNNGHASASLKWLNKWGCRINAKSPERLFERWAEWFCLWRPRLPDVALVDTGDRDLDIVADAYDELRAILADSSKRPTGASKLLFAVSPEVAMVWDDPVRKEFGLVGDRAGYRRMLTHSKAEAENLVADAARCGITDWRAIPNEIGRPGYTLPKLLDEYHWITITRGHQIPALEDLWRWTGLHVEVAA
jgi:hypothetical protein